MDINKIRGTAKEEKLEVIIEELWGNSGEESRPKNDAELARKVIDLENCLHILEKYNFKIDNVRRLSIVDPSKSQQKTIIASSSDGLVEAITECSVNEGYSAYSFLRDFLGIGMDLPFDEDKMKYTYPEVYSIMPQPCGVMTWSKSVVESLLKYAALVVNDKLSNSSFNPKN